MPKILTQQQIDTYWRDGCVFPIRVMSESDALEIRERLEAFEKKTGGPLKGDLRHKSHLLFSWLGDLVRQDRIVDAIEDLYGPNLLCWTTNFFIKEANNPAFVSWHQDSTYWGLIARCVTAWVAFTPSNKANGAMGFMPGTHTSDQIPHRDTFAKNNLLTRGRKSPVEVDESKAVTIELEPGRDVASPRAAGPRLAAESVERPAHRLRDPLHPDLGCAGRRRGQRDAGARRGRAPPLRARAAARRRTWTRRSCSCTSRSRAQRAHPLSRHAGEELQRSEGVARPRGMTPHAFA
jgi:hypothetical protein